MSDGRKQAGAGWNFWRGFVGFAYLIAAGFNLFVTLPHGELTWFAENAWWPFLTDLMDELIIPNHAVFMTIVVVLEIVVGLLILGRGRYVDVGVGASVAWVVLLMPFLPLVPMGLTNIVLALLQGVLLIRRYETPIWQMIVRPLGAVSRAHPR